MACSARQRRGRGKPAKKQSWRQTDGPPRLTGVEMRGLLDAIEPFQREDRVGELVGAAVQHGTARVRNFCAIACASETIPVRLRIA